ncbi:MAG: thioredoxin [Sphingomonadales bacterium]|nr:thioredoxin [Sphingomonadales bacterium]
MPVLVDFHATWCGPCKTLAPILEQVKSSLGDTVKIIKIDVDKNPALAEKLNISGVPTLILYRSGKLISRKSGVLPSAEIIKMIKGGA